MLYGFLVTKLLDEFELFDELSVLYIASDHKFNNMLCYNRFISKSKF